MSINGVINGSNINGLEHKQTDNPVLTSLNSTENEEQIKNYNIGEIINGQRQKKK